MTTDAPCVICGSSLWGLEADSFCPECGTPIERLLRGDDLSCASPQWLKRVRIGVSFDLAANGLSLVSMNVYLGSLSPFVSPQQWIQGLVEPVLVVSAAWLISVREPRLHACLRDCASLYCLIMILFIANNVTGFVPSGFHAVYNAAGILDTLAVLAVLTI